MKRFGPLEDKMRRYAILGLWMVITGAAGGIIGGCIAGDAPADQVAGDPGSSDDASLPDSVQEVHAAPEPTPEIAQTDAEIASADTVINYSCGPRVNPSGNDVINRITVRSTSLPNGGSVQLRQGWMPFYQQYVYWTRVTGNKSKRLHLDWSDSGGSSYHICNENWFEDNDSAYTLAVNDPGGRVFKYYAFVGNWYGSSGWYNFWK